MRTTACVLRPRGCAVRRMKLILLLVALCATALTLSLGGIALAAADTWQVRTIPLPVAGATPTFVSTDGSFLPWTGTVSGGYAKTYVFNLSTGLNTLIPATGITGPYYNPSAGGPYVAYQGARVGGYDDIYVYNTGTGVVTQVTHNTDAGDWNDWNDWNPRVDGGRVVWEKKMLGASPAPGIYMYTVGAGTTELLLAGDGYRQPDIWGNYMVCVKSVDSSNGAEIILYNMLTHTPTTIATGTRANAHPRIDSGRVVWTSGDIYTSGAPNTETTYQIQLYNIGTGTTTPLTADAKGNVNPSVNADYVAWQTTNAPGIWCYNSTTSNTTKVSTVADTPQSPELSASGLAWIGTTGLYFAVPTDVAPRFPDVPTGYQYYAAIEDLAARGIVEGFADGNFRPLDLVWRQQFAKMIVLTMAAYAPAAYTATLSDMCTFADASTITHVDGELYAYHYVAKAASTGLTIGYTNNTFRPFNNITRQQVITMIVRAGNREGVLATPPAGWVGVLSYTDPTHGQNTRTAEYNGLLADITGPAGTLASWNTTGMANRGEVAQMLHNLLTKLLAP
jgi:hypothetical protein